MSVKSKVSWPDECIFYNFPEFSSRESVDHYVTIFAVENPAAFYINTQKEKGDCLSIRKRPSLLTTRYIDFNGSLEYVLTIHILLGVSVIALPF